MYFQVGAATSSNALPRATRPSSVSLNRGGDTFLGFFGFSGFRGRAVFLGLASAGGGGPATNPRVLNDASAAVAHSVSARSESGIPISLSALTISVSGAPLTAESRTRTTFSTRDSGCGSRNSIIEALQSKRSCNGSGATSSAHPKKVGRQNDATLHVRPAAVLPYYSCIGIRRPE